jgi:hypothetical protein
MRDAVGIGLENADRRAGPRGQEMMPMFLNRDVDRDKAVIGGVDAERRARMAAVARSRWNAARLPVGVKMRSEGGVNGFLPRYFDQPALYRALALEQRCGYSGVEVIKLRAPARQSGRWIPAESHVMWFPGLVPRNTPVWKLGWSPRLS